LTHQIIGERRIITSGKAYGIKVRCYGEHVGEHIENLMGTHWELRRNIMKTHWESGENEKKSFAPKFFCGHNNFVIINFVVPKDRIL